MLTQGLTIRYGQGREDCQQPIRAGYDLSPFRIMSLPHAEPILSKAGSILVLLEKPIQQSDNLFTGRFERTLDILALPMRNQKPGVRLEPAGR